jgi:hypothetical protein
MWISIICHVKIKSDANPYDPLCADYLKMA